MGLSAREKALEVWAKCKSGTPEEEVSLKIIIELSESMSDLKNAYIKIPKGHHLNTFCLRKMLDKCTSYEQVKEIYGKCPRGSNVETEAKKKMLSFI